MSEPGTSAAIITCSAEGGLNSPAPSDILKDVVAYVEVRTMCDNRSSAVKHVLEQMGANVEEKLSNNVTHVIFKEGKKRTRDRALKLGAHLVSVLWVDRCKELQIKADESQFPANTERCGTPPPGVRWKKYKSMQPRDFADDLARSTERCKKRLQKVMKQKLLLQGRDSGTPLQYHSPSHVLVVDTQPRSPFVAMGLGFESPVFIPNTPPSMQARLNQMMQDKEARRRGEMDESPVGEMPLQRILFENDSPTPEDAADSRLKNPETKSEDTDTHSGETNTDSDIGSTQPEDTDSQSNDTTQFKNINSQSKDTDTHLRSMDTESKLTNTHSVPSRRRSTRLSGRIDMRAQPFVMQPRQTENLQDTMQTIAKRQPNPAFTLPTVAEQTSDGTESAVLCVNSQKKSRPPTSPKTTILHNRMKADKRIKKKDRRKTVGGCLAQVVDKSNTENQKQCPKNELQCLQVQRHSRIHARRSLDSSMLQKQSYFDIHSGLGKASEGTNESVNKGETSCVDNAQTGDDTCSPPDVQHKPKHVSSAPKHKLSKKVADELEMNNSNTVSDSASQVSRCSGMTSKSASHKPTAKRKKLLNPTQDPYILSPSPAENSNITSTEPDGKERKRKRTSCSIDAIFPNDPSASTNSHSSKENRRKKKKRGSSQINPNNSKESTSEASSRHQAKVMRGSRSKSDLSDMCSTSQSSSLLGSSMSIVYNDSSTLDLGTRRFAPPRNSIAEFQVQKPVRKRTCGYTSRQAVTEKGRSKGDEQAKLMNLQKFQLNGMPSLVMTCLHRQEQEDVISAVKNLGVFRIENRVSKNTTHVVYGDPKRTLNVLHSLARGCWLISKQWVLHSMEKSQWVSEDDYEAVEEFVEAKEARLAREAVPPNTYHCSLFKAVGSFFVSNTCTPPRLEMLKLLELCGAKVTDCIQRADFYLGDQCYDEKNSIRPVWVLDCISQQKLLPMDDYVMAINFKAKSSSSPEY